MKRAAVLALSLLLACRSQGQSPGQESPASNLQKVSQDFWSWRAHFAPFTGDDVNRMERPGGKRDWSAAALEKRRADLAGFEARWKELEANGWSIPQQVDYRLIGSALARVHWEMEINPRWKRDPNFYLEQTLTAVAEALTVPGPYDEPRSREILARIENIPSILESAKANLTNPPAPFASVAIQALTDIRPRMQKMASALQPATTLQEAKLTGATERAAGALEKFREHLQKQLPTLPAQTALGREAYVFFLKNVALIPFTPEEILAMGRQEWDRAVAFEAFEKNRNIDVPPLQGAENLTNWMADTAAKELQIRKFLEAHNLLTVPDWVQHYVLRPVPEYLAALGFTEEDDFTSPSRLRYARKGDASFHAPTWNQSWFPDAFAGTMAQLLIAIEEGTEPTISGRDNLRTMALVDAAYRSAAEHRAISPEEVTRESAASR